MMSFHSIPFRALPLIALTAFSGSGHAQEFIPDTLVRNWLNTVIPGIVDANGIMDTLHPGIAVLDSAQLGFAFPVEYDTLDLYGIQYLDSLKVLNVFSGVNGATTVNCPELPISLHTLSIGSTAGTLNLPQLPTSLRTLNVYGNGPDPVGVNIIGMPPFLEHANFSEITDVNWAGTCHTEHLSFQSLLPIERSLFVPAIQADTAGISYPICISTYLDLSMVSTNFLSLNVALAGPLKWPSDLNRSSIFGSFDAWLQPFPETLLNLYINSSSAYCLPFLPNSLTSLTLDGPPECMPNWPIGIEVINSNGQDVLVQDVSFCSVLNSDCPSVYPGISGTLHIDANQNGQCDPGEPPLPQASVTLLPNDNITNCDANGYWEIGVQPGNYTIAPSTSYPYIQSISPTEHTANVPTMGDADTLNDFAVTLIPNIEDLRAFLTAEPARPGFDNRLYLTCQNYGTVPMDAQLTLEYDADQTWIGSSIVPSAQSGNTATWTFTGMAIGASQTIAVDLTTPVSVPLGTPITYILSALPTSGDETPSDNLVVHNDSVVGSYDPNDKLLSPSVMTPTQVQAGGTPINYIIRFQNTGTYLAERVLILDTLPAGLHVESIQFLGSSHACDWYVTDGVLHVLHQDINLPDSTSDEANSHGFIRFSILPETDLWDGAEIVNIAHIVFDFNEPIITPPATFRVDATAVVTELAEVGLRLHPNPVRDRLWITLPQHGHASISYVVQDLFGRTVLTGLTRSDVATDVSELPSGVFVLTATGEASTLSTRFVKQ